MSEKMQTCGFPHKPFVQTLSCGHPLTSVAYLCGKCDAELRAKLKAAEATVERLLSVLPPPDELEKASATLDYETLRDWAREIRQALAEMEDSHD